MFKQKCKKKGCKKTIEGYSKEHVAHLMEQHLIGHRNKELKQETKEQ